MEIENQDTSIKSDSQDSWDPEQFNHLKNESTPSLFQKVTISYDDQTIEKNLDIQCEKPIINSTLFPFQDEQNDEEVNLQETKQEPSQNETLNSQKQSKNKMQSEETSRKKKSQKPMDDQEALFNAIEDDQNEHWIRKKLRNQLTETNKLSRPLTCPQCFTQLCYKYQTSNKSHKTPQNEPLSETDKLVSTQKTYKAKVVDNVTIHEHKIIRNRLTSQNMQNKLNLTSKQSDEKGLNVILEKYQKCLKDRYDDINVKILTSCSECGLDIGYWDANEEMYILFNVI